MRPRAVRRPLRLGASAAAGAAAAMFSAAIAPGQPASGGPPSSVNIGSVRPSNRQLPKLAAFGAEGLAKIVSDDLLLGDIAAAPDDAAMARAAGGAAGAEPAYDEFAKAGVGYALRITGGQAGADAELFDVASRKRVFGKRFADRGAGFAPGRAVAHAIANDVTQALTGHAGPFSSRIAYLTGRGGGNRDVAVIDADGRNGVDITREGSIVATPCWGQNGTEVYFTTYKDNNPDLAGMTLGGRRFNISRRPGLNTSPSWSAAEQRIAACLSKDGNGEIYTMTRDGRSPVRLTNDPSADTAPDWSPDGSRIAFTSDRGGKPAIYTMPSSGGAASKVSGQGYCDSAAWSPDGKRLVYVAREGGGFQIYVLDLSVGGAAQRMTGGGDNTDPAWGPGGRHLVFASDSAGGRDLHMLNTDTRGVHRLTQTRFANSPVWGPAIP